MSTHIRPSGRWLGGLALVLVGLLSVLGWASTAQVAPGWCFKRGYGWQ